MLHVLNGVKHLVNPVLGIVAMECVSQKKERIAPFVILIAVHVTVVVMDDVTMKRLPPFVLKIVVLFPRRVVMVYVPQEPVKTVSPVTLIVNLVMMVQTPVSLLNSGEAVMI
jgi:hypothetical protein